MRQGLHAPRAQQVYNYAPPDGSSQSFWPLTSVSFPRLHAGTWALTCQAPWACAVATELCNATETGTDEWDGDRGRLYRPGRFLQPIGSGSPFAEPGGGLVWEACPQRGAWKNEAERLFIPLSALRPSSRASPGSTTHGARLVHSSAPPGLWGPTWAAQTLPVPEEQRVCAQTTEAAGATARPLSYVESHSFYLHVSLSKNDVS